MKIAKHILWIDCTAATFAGLIVLLAAQWLSQLYHLPKAIIVFVGCVNLLYACYSFILANYKKRSIFLVNILVIANSIWVLVCLIMLWKFWQEMTIFAVLHIAGEAVFVGILARLEYQWRYQLTFSYHERNN
ncbi:hypothetical protein [Acinetobacter genomosp. 15BJ]|uniref:Uncharacterized protein n=1 Tax=Acinetobacter genomosp. 15BJ TaxID=106651 RepID=R9B5L2_9GAMM|nr:hypothetical protein [Acinetobacter genomosp. 15BJ]EOR09575.1 hypothetical protein F896_00596 [Acinetobacter genomosp. 15BJ]MCH7292999.1 hypothetical protein [Acinetobacter genomosp. 15BJ]MDO3659127.1 hypothetical protein [Acinetobacter genomosp. 15BJ]